MKYGEICDIVKFGEIFVILRFDEIWRDIFGENWQETVRFCKIQCDMEVL